LPTLIFHLRGVGDDEHDEVCALLDRYGFDYYETSAGRWGFGVPAIWMRDETEATRARQLIDQYQRQRQERMALQREQTPTRSWRWQLYLHPFRFMLVVIGVMAVLTLSSLPLLILWWG
jgi:hypothetical protein